MQVKHLSTLFRTPVYVGCMPTRTAPETRTHRGYCLLIDLPLVPSGSLVAITMAHLYTKL
jgi:hypothetical protein